MENTTKSNNQKKFFMKNKKKILKLIKILSNGSCYSKKEIANLIKTKKKKIKKYIFILKKMGIKINIIKNKKYQIKKKIFFLNKKKIYKFVKKGKIIIKPIINSTNKYLKSSIQNLKSGDVCLTEHQTNGQGRLGKYWFSPFGYNLYLSMYWQFNKKISNILSISLVVGIVVTETINRLTGSNIKIKWPNDLFLKKKKIAGILIESINKKNTNHIIIGIGINLNISFNNKIKQENKWTCLEENGFLIEKNKLSGKIISSLHNEIIKFEKHGLKYFINRWITLDKFLNKKTKIFFKNNYKIGIAKGINKFGSFLLKKNGKIFSFQNGKILI